MLERSGGDTVKEQNTREETMQAPGSGGGRAARVKRPALVLAFASTAQAMATEKYCAEHQLPGRLIPVPKEITAGCGLAWKAEVEQEELLTKALSQAGIQWQESRVLELWA